MRRALERLARELPDQLEPALKAEAQAIIAAANADVPVQSGELASSSFVSSVRTKRGAVAVAGYADDKAPAVHEGFHGGKKTATPHQFWLQKAANRALGGMAARIAARLKGIF